MNLYEHTIVARQDTSPSQIKQLTEKYSKIVEKNEGDILKTENWGLLNLSYIIKKNRKGNYIHFKIKGSGKIIDELEKNESLDKNLLRYMTVKVKKFDLETNYFLKNEDSEKNTIRINENFHKLMEIRKKNTEEKIKQMKIQAIKDIRNISVDVALESVQKLMLNSLDKNKLDKIFSQSIEETKLALQKKSS